MKTQESPKATFRLGKPKFGPTFKLVSTPADKLRRWLGLFCLAIAGGMLVWGETILSSILRGWVFLIYWFICFLFTFAAIAIALIDVRVVRQRTQREQRELMEKTLEEIERQRARTKTERQDPSTGGRSG